MFSFSLIIIYEILSLLPLPAIDEGVLTDNSFASTLLVTHFLLADALYMYVAAMNELGAWWTMSSIVGEEI